MSALACIAERGSGIPHDEAREFIHSSAAQRRGRWRQARSSRASCRQIGFLGSIRRQAWNPWTAAFVQRLRELGWIEGRTIAIEVSLAEGRSERFAGIAAEFVRLKVDVIVTAGPQPSRQRKQRRRFQSSLRCRPIRLAAASSRPSATRRQPYRPIAPANRRRRQTG